MVKSGCNRTVSKQTRVYGMWRRRRTETDEQDATGKEKKKRRFTFSGQGQNRRFDGAWDTRACLTPFTFFKESFSQSYHDDLSTFQRLRVEEKDVQMTQVRLRLNLTEPDWRYPRIDRAHGPSGDCRHTIGLIKQLRLCAFPNRSKQTSNSNGIQSHCLRTIVVQIVMRIGTLPSCEHHDAKAIGTPTNASLI